MIMAKKMSLWNKTTIWFYEIISWNKETASWKKYHGFGLISKDFFSLLWRRKLRTSCWKVKATGDDPRINTDWRFCSYSGLLAWAVPQEPQADSEVICSKSGLQHGCYTGINRQVENHASSTKNMRVGKSQSNSSWVIFFTGLCRICPKRHSSDCAWESCWTTFKKITWLVTFHGILQQLTAGKNLKKRIKLRMCPAHKSQSASRAVPKREKNA